MPGFAVPDLLIPPGSTMGRYEVVRPVGSGAGGVVYEAWDPLLSRRVALKVLRSATGSGAPAALAVARFQREARAAAQIRHPHVVPIFDVGMASGFPFLVMEFVEGETISQKLQREKKLSLECVAEMMLPILSAVAELHAAGIVHRDIKPANILLAGSDGANPRLADFGISRMDDGAPSLTNSGAILGSPGYLAPELICASQTASELTDQYALGVILYECATGQLPFGGRTTYERMHAAVTQAPDAPSSRISALPPPFDDLVLRALRRQPRERFASVDDLAQALLTFASPAVAARWRSEFTEPRLGAVDSEAKTADELQPIVRTPWPRIRRAIQPAARGIALGGAGIAIVGALLFARTHVRTTVNQPQTAASIAQQPSPIERARGTSAAPSSEGSMLAPGASQAPSASRAAEGAPENSPASPPPRHTTSKPSHASSSPPRYGAPPKAPERAAPAGETPMGENGSPILDVP
jgi:serine/threonine-protein kinase